MTAFKALLGKRLDEVTGLDVERWRAGEIARGLRLETINRDIASIKAVFNRAVDLELIAANPLAKPKQSRTDDSPTVPSLAAQHATPLPPPPAARAERRGT